MIGNVDVKTKSVHFYVQRNTGIPLAVSGVIPWEVEQLNEGNAMDLSTGVFTVPVTGIYHFDFSAVQEYSFEHLYVFLQVNGANMGWAFTKGNHAYDTISLSSSLHLQAGDKVNLFKKAGYLHDSTRHSTHFTGWLVEEDLI